MLPVEHAEIRYADQSVYRIPEDGTWAEAPPFGVQCVVYYHTEGKTIQVEADDLSRYYYLGTDELEGHKLGLWMDSDGYYRIIDAAKGGQP